MGLPGLRAGATAKGSSVSIFESFVDELNKIARLPGKPIGRTLEKPEASEGKIKFFKSMGKPEKVLEGIEEKGAAKARRSSLAGEIKDLRKHIGHASARSHLAEIRVREGEGVKFGKARARMAVPLSEKSSLSKKHTKKARERGEEAFKEQSRKELKRAVRKGEVPGR